LLASLKPPWCNFYYYLLQPGIFLSHDRGNTYVVDHVQSNLCFSKRSPTYGCSMSQRHKPKVRSMWGWVANNLFFSFTEYWVALLKVQAKQCRMVASCQNASSNKVCQTCPRDCLCHEDALFREAILLKENGPSWQPLRLPYPILAVFKIASLCHSLWIYTIAPFFASSRAVLITMLVAYLLLLSTNFLSALAGKFHESPVRPRHGGRSRIGRSLSGNITSRVFALQDFYQGQSFFEYVILPFFAGVMVDWGLFGSNFDFFSDADPTNGLVNYQTREDAIAKKLAYVQGASMVLAVDDFTFLPVGSKRDS